MSWLCTIARNRAIDILRSHGSAGSVSNWDPAEFLEQLAAPGDHETEMLELAALKHCLAEIKEPVRSCILLDYYDGYSREELATRYDRPVNTIKIWLYRGLGVLKSCLEHSS